MKPTIQLLTTAILLLMATTSIDAQTTRYVDPTGSDSGGCTDSANPCATINYTVGIAGEGDIIDLAAGVYTESVETGKSLSFIGHGTAQPGGTIIQAHTSPGVSEDIVLNLTGDNQQFEISNLIIRNGRKGVRFFNTNSALPRSLSVSDVVVTNNQGSDFGAGMEVLNGTVTLENILFHNNTASSSVGGTTAGGGLSLNSESAMVTNVIFTENKAINGRGGGLSMGEAAQNVVLENVFFTDNEANLGGAVAANAGSTSTFKNAEFVNNKATNSSGGGLFIQASDVSLVNAVFLGNESVMTGGAILVSAGSSLSLVNSVIADNESDLAGGGIRVNTNSSATFLNSILWNNISGNDNGHNISIEDSSVNGTFSLYGNAVNEITLLAGGTFDCPVANCITVSPEFINPGAGDYQLSAGSPAVDAGDPATDLSVFPGGPSNPVDLNGAARVHGGTIDMGAYEFGSLSTGGFQSMENITLYPNPVNDLLHIESEHPIDGVAIYDLSGKRVLSPSPANRRGDRGGLMDLTGLTPGIYFVEVTIGGKTGTYKILKK